MRRVDQSTSKIGPSRTSQVHDKAHERGIHRNVPHMLTPQVASYATSHAKSDIAEARQVRRQASRGREECESAYRLARFIEMTLPDQTAAVRNSGTAPPLPVAVLEKSERKRFMTPTGYTEDALVERPAIALLASLGWEPVNAYHEFDHGASTLGRETRAEVILTARLRPALQGLNPDASPEVIEQAIEELTRDRSLMSSVAANREVYQLLKNGVRIPVPDPEGDGETVEVVRVLDWDNPANNDFLLCSQFWVTGEMYTRRADLVGFVNGLPLLFIELKAAHRRLETAFNGNLRDYKDTVPQLFWPNALIILSNGSQSRVGSVTAGWEHFAEWKKVGSEDEAGRVSLETMLRGVCDPATAVGPGGKFHPVSGGPRRADQTDGQEPPVPGRQQRAGSPGRHPAARRQAGRVLAYPGQRQERGDDVLCPEGVAQDTGKLDLCGRH